MFLGRVSGTVVATQQHPFYAGRTQLLVRVCHPDGSLVGEQYVIAVDLVGAGVRQTVLVEDEGTSARQLLGTPDGPIRTVILGIVDAVDEQTGD